MNKETHADEMAEIVTKYFLQQRLKLDDPQWAAKVKPCHEILFYSMKAKQTTDQANVEKLRAAVARASRRSTSRRSRPSTSRSTPGAPSR